MLPKIPRDRKSVAREEVGSGRVGSQEGPEGACDIIWAFSKLDTGQRGGRALGLLLLLAEEEWVRGAPGHRAAGPGVRQDIQGSRGLQSWSSVLSSPHGPTQQSRGAGQGPYTAG